MHQSVDDSERDLVIHLQWPVPKRRQIQIRRKLEKLEGIGRVSTTGIGLAFRLERAPKSSPDWRRAVQVFRDQDLPIQEIDLTVVGTVERQAGWWSLRTPWGDLTLRPDFRFQTFERLCRGTDDWGPVWVHGRVAPLETCPAVTVRCFGPANREPALRPPAD